MKNKYLQDLVNSLVGLPPIRLRASSVQSLFDCPDRWIAINIEGLKTPQSDKAALGTSIHAGTACYDREVLAGQAPNISTATDVAVEALKNPNEETSWDVSLDKCINIAVSLTNKYCREEAPKHNFVAVEQECNSLILQDVGIELTGSTDRIEKTAFGLGVRDIKTGVQAVGADGVVKTDGHAAQLGVYEILAEASFGEPITAPAEIIGMSTGSKPESQRIATGQIIGAREVLLGTKDKPGMLTTAALIVHGLIPAWGNPKSMMCHKKYCPRYNNCFWRK